MAFWRALLKLLLWWLWRSSLDYHENDTHTPELPEHNYEENYTMPFFFRLCHSVKKSIRSIMNR